MSSTIKRLAIMAAAVCLLAGCMQNERMAISQSVEKPVLQNIPEAYIKLPDEPAKLKEAKRTYPVMSETAPPSATEPAPDTQTVTSQEQVKLEPLVLGDKTLYRLNGGDYMISRPLEENSNTKAAISNCATWLNELQKKHSNAKFFSYYINRATNCDWYGELNNIYAYDYATYFEKQLGTDTMVTAGRYQIADLQDYMDTGYKTDFHVNNVGSYRVYDDIYQMLSASMDLSPMLEPLNETDFDKLHIIGDLFNEKMLKSITFTQEQMDIFKVYEFNYGGYTSYINDKQINIGLEEEYAAGEIDRDPTFGHQFLYYGGQTGVIRLEFNHPEKPNLLLLSDSQGRPSRKLLASHFNRTIFLDDVQTRSADIDKIIEDNDIGVVILLGQESMFEIYE